MSGIYRIWVSSLGNADIQYSYIGVSKNIIRRVSNHFSTLKKYLKNTSEFEYYLENKSIPTKSAFYFKWAVLILMLEIDIFDFHWQIVEEKNFEKTNDIEILEMCYIDEFQSELQGMNGIFAKDFKVAAIKTWTGKISSHDEKVLKISKLKWYSYIKLLQENYHSALPWVPFQFEVMSNLNFNNKEAWNKFINEILIQFKKRKTEIIKSINLTRSNILKKQMPNAKEKNVISNNVFLNLYKDSIKSQPQLKKKKKMTQKEIKTKLKIAKVFISMIGSIFAIVMAVLAYNIFL